MIHCRHAEWKGIQKKLKTDFVEIIYKAEGETFGIYIYQKHQPKDSLKSRNPRGECCIYRK